MKSTFRSYGRGKEPAHTCSALFILVPTAHAQAATNSLASHYTNHPTLPGMFMATGFHVTLPSTVVQTHIREHNQFLANTYPIPVLGLTTAALDHRIPEQGHKTIRNLIKAHPAFHGVEPTNETPTKGKFFFLSTKLQKQDAWDYLQTIFTLHQTEIPTTLHHPDYPELRRTDHHRQPRIQRTAVWQNYAAALTQGINTNQPPRGPIHTPLRRVPTTNLQYDLDTDHFPGLPSQTPVTTTPPTASTSPSSAPSPSTLTNDQPSLHLLQQTLDHLGTIVANLSAMVKSTNDRVIAMETRQAAALATPPHPQQAAASAPATTSPAPTPSARPLASDTSGQRRPRSDEHQSDLAHFKTSLNTIRSVHESIQNPAELKNLVKE